jgi:hypothetical protein
VEGHVHPGGLGLDGVVNEFCECTREASITCIPERLNERVERHERDLCVHAIPRR